VAPVQLGHGEGAFLAESEGSFIHIWPEPILFLVTGAALVLVILSAVAHASWNFLLKRGANREIFIWWLLVSTGLLLFPLGVVLILLYPIEGLGWWYILGTIILHVLYFIFLGRGYTHGDLSVVYPIARGMGPALVPILGVLVLDENVSFLAIIGIAAILLGIYTVYWWGRFADILSNPVKLLWEPGTRYALLTGLVIAVYSVWDTVGVRYVNPFLYMYLLSVGTALVLSPYMVKAYGTKMISMEWERAKGTIVTSGLLTFLAYGLVLTALTTSKVSYIAPAREVGIVIGVLLGTLVLKEPFGKGRLIGAGQIVLGVMLVALAP
jgi:uncharacterized membrane protein